MKVRFAVKSSEGGKQEVEEVRNAPELAVAQTQMKKRDASKEKKRKIASWSTKMLEETANRPECEDTEEMVQWRTISQEGTDWLWKELCGTLGAYQRRGEPLDWRIVKKEKGYQPRRW